MGETQGKEMTPNMQEAIRELQEAATVMAGIQARQAEVLKQHGEWLQEHDRAMAEMRERDRILDERIANLVSAIGEFIRGKK